ncbi:MAG: hypothetical protein RMI94_13665 [Bryobacterales bacterium]|nr:hypothetical protein [Bryobacterales bacterium]
MQRLHRVRREYASHVFHHSLTSLPNKHTAKFGAQITRTPYADLRQGAGLLGNLSFSDRFTEFTRRLPAGRRATISRNFPTIEQHTAAWKFGFFARADFRARPDLAANIRPDYGLCLGFTTENGLQPVSDIGTGAIGVLHGALASAR